MKRKTFKIITLGCKVNQYESAALKESLLGSGCSETSPGKETDITIVNTCIVTQRASYQSRQAIRKAQRESPSGMTAAIGCYAQVYPEELSSIDGIDLIAGNSEKNRLPDILLGNKLEHTCLLPGAFESKTPFQFLPIKGFLDRTRAFLKIQDGCESFCSYCIVPYARGPLRSLDVSVIIRELKSLSEEGYKEIVLTGIHLGKYGADFKDPKDLKGLLRLIGKENFPLRIRLSSIEPNEIDQELIDMIASEDWLCRHFHIPLQSGDNGILEKMNRPYMAEEFANLIDRIHKTLPLAAVGVDTMAGFPGEDDLSFENTFKLIKDLPISYLHVFPYSPRKGTPASGFTGQVDGKVIKARARRLRSLGHKKRKVFYGSCIGETFSVLTEGWQSEEKKMIKGLSDNYLPVVFPSSKLVKNDLVDLRIDSLGEGYLNGSIIG